MTITRSKTGFRSILTALSILRNVKGKTLNLQTIESNVHVLSIPWKGRMLSFPHQREQNYPKTRFAEHRM